MFWQRCAYIHRYAYLAVKKRQVDRFVAGARDGKRIQREVLFTKIRRNAESQFGRDHGFAQMKSLEDFRRNVPVANYEYYRPYAERVKAGQIDAMFGPGTEVLMLSMTSGTTSEPKLIPITNHFFREYRKSWNTWGLGVFRDHDDMAVKEVVSFTSDWQQFVTEGGIPCGNISGLIAETRPRISNPIFVLPANLNKIHGTANKQYMVLRLTLPSRRVGWVVTANPLTLMNFARLADSQRESLIRDLYDGTLSDHVEIDANVRSALESRLRRKHRQRAKELEQIISDTGRLYPRDFWPNMSVLSVWTSGAVGVYLPTVREYYGDVPFRDHGLSASEGHMTTPLSDNTRAGLIDYDTHFFEFIPIDEHDSEQPTVLEAHELEEGKSYYILLSTSSGLYRYDIHDVVRCVGFEGSCPWLEFLNKGARYCSMTGEKLSEFQAVEAAREALSDVGLSMAHFTFAPVPGDPAHYAFLTESKLSREVAEKLAQRLDVRLSETNFEYEDRLATRRLGPIEIQNVPPGSWTAYQQWRVSKLGASSEQYKHPFLTNDAEFISQLLKLSCA